MSSEYRRSAFRQCLLFDFPYVADRVQLLWVGLATNPKVESHYAGGDCVFMARHGPKVRHRILHMH